MCGSGAVGPVPLFIRRGAGVERACCVLDRDSAPPRRPFSFHVIDGAGVLHELVNIQCYHCRTEFAKIVRQEAAAVLDVLAGEQSACPLNHRVTRCYAQQNGKGYNFYIA